jgi:hypothetical protein
MRNKTVTKICVVEYPVNFCNHQCPCFYHKYEDNENCYCSRLKKKVYDYGYQPGKFENCIMDDSIERPIPADCPLPEKDI